MGTLTLQPKLSIPELIFDMGIDYKIKNDVNPELNPCALKSANQIEAIGATLISRALPIHYSSLASELSLYRTYVRDHDSMELAIDESDPHDNHSVFAKRTFLPGAILAEYIGHLRELEYYPSHIVRAPTKSAIIDHEVDARSERRPHASLPFRFDCFFPRVAKILDGIKWEKTIVDTQTTGDESRFIRRVSDKGLYVIDDHGIFQTLANLSIMPVYLESGLHIFLMASRFIPKGEELVIYDPELGLQARQFGDSLRVRNEDTIEKRKVVKSEDQGDKAKELDPRQAVETIVRFL